MPPFPSNNQSSWAEALAAWDPGGSTPVVATIPNARDTSAAPTSQHKPGSRPHLQVRICNVPVNALVDGGADVTAVRADLAAKLGNLLTPAGKAPFPFIRDAQNHYLSIVGYYNAHFSGPNGLDVTFPVYVIQNFV